MSDWVVPGPINWERFARTDPSFPRLASVVKNAKSGETHQFGLLGMPFDGAIPTRPGARHGPEAIRHDLSRLAADDGRQALAQLDLGDYGDVACIQGNVGVTHERCYEAARELARAVRFRIFLGGDHSLTFPCFRGVAELVRPLGLITFDAHHDVRHYTSDDISSGTPFRRCLELGDAYLRASNLVQVGIRPFANSREYADYCHRQGVTCLSIRDIEEKGIVEAATLAAQVAAVRTAGVYLSIDIDVVDAAFAPGASATAPGGLTSRELLTAVSTIAERTPIVAMDVMEVSPPLDESGRTAHLAALVLATVLAAQTPGG